MTYLPRHRHPAVRRRRIAIIAAAAVVALIVLVRAVAPSAFPTLFEAAARPFWRIDLAAQSGAFSSNAGLLAENESLRLQLADLQASIASSSVAAVIAQDRELLAAAGRATTSPRRYVLGAVLARPPAVPYDELILDAGADEGVASSSLVYSPEKVLIGQVTGVLPHSATAMLFSSPHETYDVLIGPAHIPATAIGQGGGQYRASVPHGSGIQAGDIVSDSALYDRPFGIVASVVTDPSDPFDTVLFAPPVNIYQLRFVLVDTDKADLPAPARR